MASARIQRWALTLAAYSYTILYKPGKEISQADGLSRLPLPESPSEVPVPGETVLLLETIQMSPVNASQIKQWTDKDPVLLTLRQYLEQGWPSATDNRFLPYNKRKDELSLQDGCILWGNRVIVPTAGQQIVLDLLHNEHPGI